MKDLTEIFCQTQFDNSSNRILCSGALFGQPRKNHCCESTVNFKKLTGPRSISAKTAPAPPVANQWRNTRKSGWVKPCQLTRTDFPVFLYWFATGRAGAFLPGHVFQCFSVDSRPGELAQFYPARFSSTPPLIRDLGSWRSFCENGPRARQFFEIYRWFATVIFARLAKKCART